MSSITPAILVRLTRAAAAALLATAALGLTGCLETRVVSSSWDKYRQPDRDAVEVRRGEADTLARNPAQTPPGPPGSGGKANQSAIWAIELQTFAGDHASTQAQTLADELTRDGLTELWVSPSGKQATIYRGTYISSSAPRAQRDLAAVQQFRHGGSKPFASAKLVAPDSVSPPVTDPCNLKQYVGMYSLQLGYYDENFGPSFREAAEEAVRVLRSQGEQAFYYHSPVLSMVTLGLFNDQDFVMINGLRDYGPAMRALQRRYPHHMANGRAIMEKIPGQTESHFQETGIIGPID